MDKAVFIDKPFLNTYSVCPVDNKLVEGLTIGKSYNVIIPSDDDGRIYIRNDHGYCVWVLEDRFVSVDRWRELRLSKIGI